MVDLSIVMWQLTREFAIELWLFHRVTIGVNEIYFEHGFFFQPTGAATSKMISSKVPKKTMVPSGKRLHNYGKIHHALNIWIHQLFRLDHSQVRKYSKLLVYQRITIATITTTVWHNQAGYSALQKHPTAIPISRINKSKDSMHSMVQEIDLWQLGWVALTHPK